jgi:hypothetical protein
MRFSRPSFTLATLCFCRFSNAFSGLNCRAEPFALASDVTGLVNGIFFNTLQPAQNNPSSVSLQAGHFMTFESNSARACIANEFLFENTHINMEDLGDEVLGVVQSCNGGAGSATVLGDSGLSLILDVTSNLDSSSSLCPSCISCQD